MRRIGSAFGRKESNKETERQRPVSYREELPPIPPPEDTWVVDEAFLEESSRLVPASPDDVDDVTRSMMISRVFKTGDWIDLDLAEYGLGVALDIFPANSTFNSVKWVFWTENALNNKLSNLVQALARPESKCLESRTSPDFQFRRCQAPV